MDQSNMKKTAVKTRAKRVRTVKTRPLSLSTQTVTIQDTGVITKILTLVFSLGLIVSLFLFALAQSLGQNAAASMLTNDYCNDLDQGEDYFTASLANDNFNQNKADVCVVSEQVGLEKKMLNISECDGGNCYIQEAVCSGTRLTSKIYQCPNGCLNGACKSPTPEL